MDESLQVGSWLRPFQTIDCVPLTAPSTELQNYEGFTAAIDDWLNNLSTRYKDQMATLLTLNFQTFEAWFKNAALGLAPGGGKVPWASPPVRQIPAPVADI